MEQTQKLENILVTAQEVKPSMNHIHFFDVASKSIQKDFSDKGRRMGLDLETELQVYSDIYRQHINRTDFRVKSQDKTLLEVNLSRTNQEVEIFNLDYVDDEKTASKLIFRYNDMVAPLLANLYNDSSYDNFQILGLTPKTLRQIQSFYADLKLETKNYLDFLYDTYEQELSKAFPYWERPNRLISAGQPPLYSFRFDYHMKGKRVNSSINHQIVEINLSKRDRRPTETGMGEPLPIASFNFEYQPKNSSWTPHITKLAHTFWASPVYKLIKHMASTLDDMKTDKGADKYKINRTLVKDHWKAQTFEESF